VTGNKRELPDLFAPTVDVTEQKWGKEALRRAKDELEVQVQQRTDELGETNKALRAEITRRWQAQQSLRESQEELAFPSASLWGQR